MASRRFLGPVCVVGTAGTPGSTSGFSQSVFPSTAPSPPPEGSSQGAEHHLRGFHCYSGCPGGPTQAGPGAGGGKFSFYPCSPLPLAALAQTQSSPAVETCTSSQKNELAGSQLLGCRISQSGTKSASPTSRDKGPCQRPVPQTAGWEQYREGGRGAEWKALESQDTGCSLFCLL